MAKANQKGKYKNIKIMETKNKVPSSASGLEVMSGNEINIRIIPINIESIIIARNTNWKKIACKALNFTNFDLSFWLIQIIIGARIPMFGISIDKCERSDMSFSSVDIFSFILILSGIN